MNERAIRVAVVGAGGWGKNHVRVFATTPGSELRYICDRSEAVRTNLARAYPHAKAVDDLSIALGDPELDAVVIATDPRSHHALALAALKAGKDVFVEKPLTLSAETSEELCEVAEREGRILMVGHLLLYHPAVETLKSIIDSGELGDVLYLYAQRLNLGVVRRDENAWWSLAPHDISLAHHLLGAEATMCSAQGGIFLQRDRAIEDVVFATLEIPGGRIAHVHVSWLDPHKTRCLTVVGSKKMAIFDDTSADQKLVLYDKGVEAPPSSLSYEQGVRVRTGDIRIPALRMHEPLGRECEAFLSAIRTRQKPLADGRSGLAVVRVLEAGTRSLSEQGRRVETGATP